MPASVKAWMVSSWKKFGMLEQPNGRLIFSAYHLSRDNSWAGDSLVEHILFSVSCGGDNESNIR